MGKFIFLGVVLFAIVTIMPYMGEIAEDIAATVLLSE